jgi:type II secretory pathway pseudopilin PulG
MPITFTCPHCGHRTDVADQFAGQSGPCARCGQTITIPLPAGAPGAPAPVPRRGTSGGAIAAIVIGVVLVVGVCVIGVPVALIVPAIGAAREAARRTACQNNLRQIALALHTYHDINGTLPPAYTVDPVTGQKMHSWRVLILPYLEQQHIYDQYDFTQPWDSPANQRLVAMMPAVYGCPSEDDDPAGAGLTHYQVIVGANTPFNGSQAMGLSTLTSQDGTANTFLVVEAQAPVNWLEPADLNYDGMSFQVNGPGGNGLGSDHPGGASAAMCDASVRFVPDATVETNVQAAATASGGEAVYLDF